jgi:hypothetical protein
MTTVDLPPSKAKSPPESEALVKEARRRRRRRRASVALLLAIVVCAGVVAWALIDNPKPPSTDTGRPTARHTASPSSSGIVPERPEAMAVGPNGNLYVSDDSLDRIIERRPDGSFVVVAGTGKTGSAGDGGPAVDAAVGQPGPIAFGPDGTLYFVDQDAGSVRAISAEGKVATIAGGGDVGRTGGWIPDGTPALSADLNPGDIAFGRDNALYIATGEEIMRLNGNGTLTHIVGEPGPYQGVYGIGGPAVDASSDGANGMAFDSAGDLYIAGSNTKTLLIVTANATMTLPYGAGSHLYPRGDGGLVTAPDGSVVAMDELSLDRLTTAGSQTITSFYPGLFHGIHGFSPNGVAIGRDGSIYVDTFYGNGYTDTTAIAEISPSGRSTILWESRPPRGK